MNAKDFTQSLVAAGVATQAEYQEILGRYQGDAFSALQFLARVYPGRMEELGRLWGTAIGVAYVNPARTLIQYELVLRLPEKFARANRVLPLYEMGGAFTVAIVDPADRKTLSQVENYLGGFVSAVFAYPEQIDAALEIAFETESTVEAQVQEELAFLRGHAGPLSLAELEDLTRGEAFVRFARSLILLALKRRASDIHIEPGAKSIRVRFRIDGVLQEIMSLELPLLAPLVTRFKIMADTDIAETRKSQDGRVSLPLADRSVDVRFSCVPTIHGEKVVLRILGFGQFADIPDPSELDFCRPVFTAIERVLEAPNGLFFVTGPTGSGKTTTLCALLKHLHNPGINIVTIEDPVEYTMEGINQIYVNAAAEMTFATSLRAILRQDPDVILVGEIRDLETATVATRAALTGHLVLTTLHTNDALQAVTRMLDLGVEPALLAPSIIGSMAQRLVRRVCRHCRQAYEPDEGELDRFFLPDNRETVRLYRARGCAACGQTGYLGRLGVHEVVLADDELRRLIARNAPYGELAACAARAGHRTLRYDGLKKVLLGLTTFDEIERVSLLD